MQTLALWLKYPYRKFILYEPLWLKYKRSSRTHYFIYGLSKSIGQWHNATRKARPFSRELPMLLRRKHTCFKGGSSTKGGEKTGPRPPRWIPICDGSVALGIAARRRIRRKLLNSSLSKEGERTLNFWIAREGSRGFSTKEHLSIQHRSSDSISLFTKPLRKSNPILNDAVTRKNTFLSLKLFCFFAKGRIREIKILSNHRRCRSL